MAFILQQQRAIILNVPIEISSNILATTLAQANDAYSHYTQLETLRLVCRLWNASILSTAAFWSIIHLQQLSGMAARCLDRSQGHVLDIYGPPQRVAIREECTEQLRDHAHRIRLIRVAGWGAPQLSSLLAMHMSALQSLLVDTDSQGPPPFTYFPSLANIRLLSLNCVHLDPHQLDLVHGLRYLTLIKACSLQDTLSIISRNSELRTLKARPSFTSPSARLTPQDSACLPLSHLRALTLEHADICESSLFLKRLTIRRECSIDIVTELDRGLSQEAILQSDHRLVASIFKITSASSSISLKISDDVLCLVCGPVKVALMHIAKWKEEEGACIFRALKGADRPISLHIQELYRDVCFNHLDQSERHLFVAVRELIAETQWRNVENITIDLLDSVKTFLRPNMEWCIRHSFPELLSLEIRATKGPTLQMGHRWLFECISHRSRASFQSGLSLEPAASMRSLRLVGLRCPPGLLNQLRALIPEVVVEQSHHSSL
ncbi:hypothetical protein FRB93_001830 [Tulasnella sp. JGI-2019a]|nr:hypothetical protein FRB93_001830 [Tulasnella sp. JGI-2019a]